MKYKIYGKSVKGSSEANGDLYYISDDKKLILLADGASGAGEDGKCLMGQVCLDILKNSSYTNYDNIESYLDELFWEINNKLIEISQQRRKLIYGTLVVGIFHDDMVSVASLGDSPTYYFNNEHIAEIARSLKKHEWMIENGHISRKEYDDYISSLHPWMMSSFSFFLPMVIPNHKIETVSLTEDNILTICCDGISDWLQKEEIIKHIREDGLEDGISNILDLSKKRSMEKENYCDDMTIVGIEIS